MSVYVWPPNALPQSIEWQYLSPSRAVISPFDGDSTIIGRTGDRWAGRCSFSPIFDDTKADLEAFLGRVRHQYHQFVMPPRFVKKRGSFVPTNLAPNSGTFDVIGPWTSNAATISIETGMLRVQNSGAASGSARSGAITVVANTQYVFRIECIPGSTATFRLFAGTAAGGTTIFDSGTLTSTPGIYTVTFNSGANTTLHFSIRCETLVSADFVYFDNLIIEQCALTNGTQVVGDLLSIKNLNASTAELLKKADMIEVAGQLLQLLHGLTSDGSGNALVRVTPPLRSAVATNTAVILGTPMGRFYMVDEPTKWTTQGFFEGAFNLNIMEDLTT